MRNILGFDRIHKITNTYHTLVTYTNHACLFHASEGESSGQSWLFAKALLCATCVVKADRVQGGATTGHVYKR